MTYSDDLYQLIRSMTKAEKRHFKLFASRYGQDKIYLHLFDELNRQKEYDEAKLRERFHAESDTGQFHTTKNYLYRMIMKSLRSFNRGNSRQAKVQELISDVRLLYDRGLFKQARKFWRQAERLVRHVENPHLRLELVELRFVLSGKASKRLESLDSIHRDRIEALRDLEGWYRYDYLHERIGNLCTNYPRRSAEQRSELDRLIADPLLASPPTECSWRVLNLYYWAHATYHFALGEPENAFAMLVESKRLYDEEPGRKEEHYSEYVQLVGNLLVLTRQMEDYDRCEELLERLKGESCAGSNRDSISANRSHSTYLETIYLGTLHLETGRGNFDRCVLLAREIDGFLCTSASYRYGIQRNYIRLLLAYACFGCGDMKSALLRVNNLLNMGEPHKGRSAYYAARALELMIHYELGNYDLLESLERSLRNRIVSKEFCGSYESRILRFFRTVITDSTIDWNPDSYYPGEERVIFADIDFPAWIEAKGTGEKFSRVVQCRFLQRKRLLLSTPSPEDG